MALQSPHCTNKEAELGEAQGFVSSMVQAEPGLRPPKPLDGNSLFFTMYQIEAIIVGLKIGSKLQEITLMWRKKHQNFITCVWGKEDVVHKMSKTLFKRRE